MTGESLRGEPLGPERSGAAVKAKEGENVNDDRRKLAAEVRQSLSLIGMTVLTLTVSIAFGLMVGHFG